MTCQQLFQRIAPRIAKLGQSSGVSLIDAANVVRGVLFKVLWNLDSDLVKGPISIAFTSGDPSKSLAATAAGLRGFKEDPYFIDAGTTYDVPPAAYEDIKDLDGETGIPQVYELLGDTFYLYPVTDRNLTIKGRGYCEPTALTAMADTIPFNGLLDEIFVEGALRVTAEGVALASDPSFHSFVQQEAVKILHGRRKRTRRVRGHLY